MNMDYKTQIQQPALISDTILAKKLTMSNSWVRQQRFKRKKGEDHSLTIDPVMVGTSPRYRIEDVEAFIEGLAPANNNGSQSNG